MIDVIYYKVLHYCISVSKMAAKCKSSKDDIEVDFQVVFFVSIQKYILLHINLYIVCNMVNITKLNANFQGLLSTLQPFTHPLTQLLLIIGLPCGTYSRVSPRKLFLSPLFKQRTS